MRRIWFWIHLREGSTGAEFLSAVWMIALTTVLFLSYLAGRDVPPGMFFRVIAGTFPPVGLIIGFGIGVVQLGMLARAPVRPWVWVRKTCAALSLSGWSTLTADLWVRRQYGSFVVLVMFLALLVVAVRRKVYWP